MTDIQLLFLVLTALYGWECSCWLPRGSVGFIVWLGKRWRLAHPPAAFGNQRGGFILAPPLPPLGSILTASQFPLSLTSDAVLGYVASNVNPGAPPEQTGKLVQFEQIKRVEVSGKKVRVNGELLVKAASSGYAVSIADLLRNLQKMSPSARKEAISNVVRDEFDAKALRRRREEFEKMTAHLQPLANGLFLYLFGIAPWVIWFVGIHLSWLGLVIGLLAFTVTISISFRRLHKHFHPAAEDERFTQFLILLLAPASTIRARDVLSRSVLEQYHPLALAEQLCDKETFQIFARGVLLDLLRPAQTANLLNEKRAQEVEEEWRGRVKKSAEDFLNRAGYKPEELTRPPGPADETCRSYCPRCLAQFTTVEGCCSDCGGVSLVPFAAKKK